MSIIKYLVIIPLGLVLIIYSLLANAYVLMTVWKWFILPLGAEELSFKVSLAITIVIGIAFNNRYSPKLKDEELLRYFLLLLGKPIVQLIILKFIQVAIFNNNNIVGNV